MHSIRTKITAITIVEILVAILLVSLVSFSIVQAENDRQSVEMMSLVARDTRKSLEKYTEDLERAVETFSNLASDKLDNMTLVQYGLTSTSDGKISERTPEQVRQLDAYLAEYMKQLQADSASVASHTQGVITYYFCINPEVSTTEHGFFYSRVGKTGFGEREPIDARELDPHDLTHTKWYYSPIERGRPSWVGPYTAHFLDEMLICSYLVPIYKSGVLIGVLGMDIPVETLTSLVSSIHVYNTGFACLLDADGNVLWHPNLESGAEPIAPIDKNLLSKEDSGDALIRYAVKGEERQASFTTLSNGMKVAIVAPTSEVNASTIKLMSTIPLVTLAIVAVFALVTRLVMRYITEPLLRLTAASQRLADADYTVELDYKGDDEVGALTSSFQRMRDQIEAYIADLNRKVLTDDLTGLPNQRHFFELALEERERLISVGKSPALLYFNLVGMKHFNRQYGFSEGDRLIRAIADVLAKNFGKHCTSRFGQDHFAVVTDEEDLEERLGKVLRECQDVNDGKTLPIHVGIYQNSLEDVGVSIACDRAKYACDKRRGSYVSGYYYFDREMLGQIDLLRHVISHLDQALEEGWVQVYYQPIVRAVNGKVCDEEALTRWIDPVQGFLSPAQFIPALEDAGLIYRLDLYMVEQVLEKMKAQEKAGLTVVSHSINLSRSDFDSCDIVEEIVARVDAAGISRAKISVEITESMIGSDFDFMKRQVERFQALGFQVWMDDFGSGYSSLDCLQSIKFDLIKFDMSFMRKLDEGGGKVILTELMKMATALGVDTICEGVETADQVRFLQEIGCSKLQGYYFCKPIPAAETIERNERGIQIGFENPNESSYYEAVGRVNLYDLTAVASTDEDSLQNIFDTMPMAIMEVDDDKTRLVRTNKSYRDFTTRYFGSSILENELMAFMADVYESIDTGGRTIYDETLSDGSTVHFLIRPVHTNPVTGTTAVAIAVLSVSDPA